jgi:hypothetical protein
MTYRIRDWDKFQHYKDRRPPWVKLYVEIIDQYDGEGVEKRFHSMRDSAKLTFLLLLCLASRYNGVIPSIDRNWLSQHLGIANPDINPCIDAGYVVACNGQQSEPAKPAVAQPYNHASNHASNVAHKALSPDIDIETESETETETENPHARAHEGLALKLLELWNTGRTNRAGVMEQVRLEDRLPGWLALPGASEAGLLDLARWHADHRADRGTPGIRSPVELLDRYDDLRIARERADRMACGPTGRTGGGTDVDAIAAQVEAELAEARERKGRR